MMIKAVMLFLAGVALLAVIGRLRLPGAPRRETGKKVERARKCPGCGSYRIGAGPCGTPDCPEART